MWPAAPASTARRPSSTTERATCSTVGQPASSTAGSRLPCNAFPASTRAAASTSDVRQSTPTTVAPAADIAPSSSAVPTPKCVIGTPRSASVANTRALCGRTAAVVGERQRARPRVEHLDRIHPGVELNPQETDGDVGQLRHQRVPDAGSPNIIALVLAWFRLGPPSTR